MAKDNLLGQEELDQYGQPKKSLQSGINAFIKSGASPLKNQSYQGYEYNPEYDQGLTVGTSQDVGRSINQGAGEKFQNFLWGAVAGEVVGGSIEGAGYIAGLATEAFSESKENEFGIDNWLTQLGGWIKENVNESAPIYEASPGSFAPGDWGWWTKNGISTASTLSLVIPARGAMGLITKLGSKVGKFRRLAEANPAIAAFGDAVGTATFSRHAENMMESTATFDEVYNKYRFELNYSEEESVSLASEAASVTYNANWAALITDIPQYMLMLRGTKLGKAASNSNKAQATSKAVTNKDNLKGVKLGFGSGVKGHVKSAAGEVVEEIYQHNVQEEAARYADIISGRGAETTLGAIERFVVQSTSDEALSAGFWGGFGSVAQQTLGSGISKGMEKLFDKRDKKRMKDLENKLQDIIKKASVFSKYHMLMEDASNSSDDYAFSFVSGLSTLGLSYNKIKDGDYAESDGIIDEQLSDLIKKDKLEGDDLKQVNEAAENIKKDFRTIAEIHKTTKNTFNKSKVKLKNQDEIIEHITKNEFLKSKLKDNISFLNNDINELSKNYSDLEGKTEDVRALDEEIKAIQINIDALKEELKIPSLSDEAREGKGKIIKGLENKLTNREGKLEKVTKEMKDSKEKLEKYEERGDIIAKKADVMRSQLAVDTFANANKKLRSIKGSKNADKIINETKEEQERINEELAQNEQDLEESDEEAQEKQDLSDAGPNTSGNTDVDWTNDESVHSVTGGLRDAWMDDAKGEGEEATYPQLTKFIKSLYDKIKSGTDANMAKRVLGKLISQDFNKLTAEGAVSKKGSQFGFNPSSPIATQNALNAILNSDEKYFIDRFTPQEQEQAKKVLQEVKDIIKEHITGISVSAEVTNAETEVEDTGEVVQESENQSSDNRDEDKSEEQPTATKAKSISFIGTTAFYATPGQNNKKSNKYYNWDFINRADGLQVGTEVRIKVEPIEGKNISDETKAAYKVLKKITANNIPISIEAKIKGRWTKIGRLPSADTVIKDIKDGKVDRTIMAIATENGHGLQQLIDFREKLFKAGKSEFKAVVAEKVYGKPIFPTGRSVKRNRANAENISYVGNKIVLAGHDVRGYFVNNDKDMHESIGNHNRTLSSEESVRGKDGKIFAYVESSNGDPYPIQLDTIRLGDVEGGMEAIIKLITKLTLLDATDKQAFKDLRDEINEITAVSKVKEGSENTFRFNITRTQIKIARPGESIQVFRVKDLLENERILGEFKAILISKKLNVIYDRTNKEGEYTNPVTGEPHDSYNDYAVNFASDTNFDNEWSNSRFRINNPNPSPKDIVEVSEEPQQEVEPDNVEQDTIQPEIDIEAAFEQDLESELGEIPLTEAEEIDRADDALYEAAGEEELGDDNYITEKIWEDYVDTGEISKTILSKITDRIIANKKLSAREQQIFSDNSKTIEDNLRKQGKTSLVPSELTPSLSNPFPQVNKWDKKKALAWFKKNLPDMDIETVEGLINVGGIGGRKAYGLFKNAVIYISDQAQVGTEYHEAFHAVFHMFLSQEQQSAILLEAQIETGISGTLLLEEWLAERFRDHMLGERFSKEEAKKLNVFQRFIKSIQNFYKWVNKKPMTIEEVFNHIESGGFKSNVFRRPNKQFEDIRRFQLIEGFDSIEQRRRVKMLASFVWKRIEGRIKGGEIQDETKADLTKELKNVKVWLASLIKEGSPLQKEAKGKDDNHKIEAIQKIIDNYEKLIPQVLSFYNGLGLITRNAEYFNLSDKIEDINAAFNDNESTEIDKPHFQESKKDTASPLVKRYIAFMPSSRPDDLGFSDPVDFHKTMSLLLEQMAGLTNLDEMISRINELSVDKPELKRLSKRLNLKEDGQFKSAFFSTFANQHEKHLSIASDSKGFRIFNTNRRGVHNELMNEWQDNFERDHENSIATEKGVKPNQVAFKKHLQTAQNLVKILRVNKRAVTTSEIELAKSLFKTLGIDLSYSVLAKKKNNSRGFAAFINGSLGTGGVVPLLEKASRGLNPYSKEPGEKEGSSLLSLARLEARNLGDRYTRTFVNGLGNKVNGITSQTHLSKLFTALKNPEKSGKILEEYYRDGLYQVGEIVDPFLKLFSMNDKGEFKDQNFIDKFEWAVFDSIKYDGQHTKEYDKLNPKEKLRVDLELFLNGTGQKGYGWFMIPTPADKSNTTVVKLPKVSQKEGLQMIIDMILLERNRVNQSIKTLSGKDALSLHEQVKVYHKSRLSTLFTMFPFAEARLMNENRTKLKPLTPELREGLKVDVRNFLNTQANAMERSFTKKDGLNIFYSRKSEFKITQSAISKEGIKEYINPTTRVIDTKQIARDFVLSSVIYNAGLTKLLSGDTSFYKDADTLNKRFSEVTANGPRYRIGKWGVAEKFTTLIFDDIDYDLSDILGDNYKEVAATDAQGFVSLEYYIQSLKARGEWSKQHDELVQLVREGKSTPENNALFMKPLKTFTYTLEYDKDLGRMVPIQIKHSVIPLTKALVEGGKDDSLSKLKDMMESNNIDEVNFLTAVKVGARKVLKMSDILNMDVEDQKKLVKESTIEVSHEGRMIVQETPTKDKAPKFGSQLRKLILGLVKDDTKYNVEDVGEMSGKFLKDRYHTLIVDNLRDLSNNVTRMIQNPEELHRLIVSQFADRGLPDNIEKMLEIVKDPVTDKSKFKYPLTMPGYSRKIENILAALFRNNVISARVFGYSAVQFSSHGLDPGLKMVGEKGQKYAEIAISERMAKQLGITEIGWLSDEAISKIEDKYLRGIGYRIPTQGKNSMLPMRIVKVLPKESGDIAHFPIAITQQMGSDFDVDKVYMMFRDPSTKKGKVSTRNNKIIDIIEGVLTNPVHQEELLNPVGNEDIKESRRKILDPTGNMKKEELAERSSFRFKSWISPITQHEYHTNNMSGNALIGAIALHAQHHVVSYHSNYKLGLPVTLGVSSPVEILGKDENGRVADILSQYLNIALDNANDPIAGDLNINLETIKVVMLLARAHVDPHTIHLLLNEPVIKEFIDTLYKLDAVGKNAKKGRYGAMNYVAISKKFEKEFAEAREHEGDLPVMDLKFITKENKSNKEKGELLASFITHLDIADELSKDIRMLRFDTSSGFGNNIYSLEEFIQAVEERPNLSNQMEGFKMLDGYYKFAVKKAYNVISDIVPMSKKAFSILHKSMGIPRNEHSAKEAVTHAFMEYTLTDALSPISHIYDNKNKARLMNTSDDSLWSRVRNARKENNNEFLNSLLPDLTNKEDKLDYILFNKNAQWSADELSNLTMAWLDLFNDPRYEDLARDLVEYSLVTSGFGFAPDGFVDIIPAEYWIDTNFSHKEGNRENAVPLYIYWESVMDKLESGSYPSLQEFIPQFMANNVNTKYYNFTTNGNKVFKSISVKAKDRILAWKNPRNNNEAIPTSLLLTKEEMTKLYNAKGGNDYFYSYTTGGGNSYLYEFVGKKDEFYVLNVQDRKGRNRRITEYNAKEDEYSIIESNNVTDIIPESYFFEPDGIIEESYVDRVSDMQDLESEYSIEDSDFTDSAENEEEVSGKGTVDSEGIPDGVDDWMNEDEAPFQKTSKEAEAENKALNDELKEFLTANGINVKTVNEIITRSGGNAIAAAHIAKRLILVAKGKAKLDTLPEETGHFLIRMLGDQNPLVKRMMSISKDLLKDPQNAPKELRDIVISVINEYGEEYEGTSITLAEELAGKLIAKAIVDNFKAKKKNLVQRIYDTIKLLFDRTMAIFKKTNENDIDVMMGPFRTAAQYISNNETINNDLINEDNIVLYQKDKSKSSNQVTIDDIIDKRIDQASRIKAIVEHAIDVLYKKQRIFEGSRTKKIEAAQLRTLRVNLEKKLEKSAGREALLSFIENSIRPLAKARANAEKVFKGGTIIRKGELTQLSSVRSLINLYQTASAYDFIDEVLIMAIQEDFPAREIDMLRDLKEDKDIVIGIYKSKAKQLQAEWLSQYSESMTVDEIEAELTRGSIDISWQDRYIRAMSQSSDKILQLIDKAVRTEKMRSRTFIRKMNEGLVKELEKLKASGVNMTVAPEKLYSKYLEKDSHGNLTGYLVSKYTSEFYEIKSEVSKLKQQAAEFDASGAKGKSTELKKKALELNKSIETRFEDGRLVVKGKYHNKNYDSIKKDSFFMYIYDSMKEANDIIPPSKRRLYSKQYDRIKLPSIRKSFFERLTNQGASSLTASLSQALTAHEQDTVFGILDEHGKPVGEIPIHFQGPIDVKDLSFDLAASVQMYYNMAHDANSMLRIVDNLEMTKDIFKERKVNITDGSGNPIKDLVSKSGTTSTKEGSESDVYKRLVDYIDANVYGQMKKKGSTFTIFGKTWDSQKISSAFLKYNAILSLSTNVLSAVANPIVGGVLQVAEAAGGEFYGPEDYTNATKIYAIEMANGDLAADMVNGTNYSKINAMNELFNFIQEYSSFESGVKNVKHRYGKIFSGTSMFFMHNAGEHWLQSRLMIAMMQSHTINNKREIVKRKKGEPKMWDQLEVKEGQVYYKGKLFEQLAKGNSIIDFHLKGVAINQRMHGNYTDIDRSALHRTIQGQWMFQFRNWMVAGYDRRWGLKRFDTRLNQDVEGNYLTSVKFMYNMIRDFKQLGFNMTAHWDKLTSVERANVKRTMMEAVYLGGVLLLLSFLSGGPDDEDEDKGYSHNFLAYQLERLYTELRFFSSITEFFRLAQSPAAGLSTIEKITNIFEAMIDPLDTYDSGSRTGELKIMKASAQLVPVWRDVDKNRHIEHLLQYFRN